MATPLLRFISKLSLVCSLSVSTAVQAGFVTVFSDVNFYNSSSAGYAADNEVLARNLLGAGNRALISRQNGVSHQSVGLNSIWSGEVTSAYELHSLSYLNTFDLVVLDIGFNDYQWYNTSEINTLRDYLWGGGDLALIAETGAYDTARINSLNSLLSGLSSSIRVSGAKTEGGIRTTSQVVRDSNVDWLTQGVNAVQFGWAHDLYGGDSAVRYNGFDVVMTQQLGWATPPPSSCDDGDPSTIDTLVQYTGCQHTSDPNYSSPSNDVPEPPVWILMGLGLAGLLVARRRAA